MPRHKPKLIEPSPVFIEQKDTDTTVYDDTLREPVKQVERLRKVCLHGQVSWAKTSDIGFFEGGQGGPINDATGYIVFHRDEIVEKCLTLQKGDRIVEVAGAATNVYLERVTYAGHHKGIAWLHVWRFVDHDPTKGG